MKPGSQRAAAATKQRGDADGLGWETCSFYGYLLTPAKEASNDFNGGELGPTPAGPGISMYVA